MRLRVTKWSLIRLLRLGVGVAGTVQGIFIGELALSILAFVLVYMALAVYHTDENQMELDEIKARL
jgi:hypothetical protein